MVCVQLGAEKAKALIGFHCFSDFDTVEKFTGKSKDTQTTSFLNSELEVSKVFQLIPRRINTKIMHNLEIFATKVYNKKHLKVTIMQNYIGVYNWKTFGRLEEERY